MDYTKYCEGLGIVPNPLPKRIASADTLSLNTFGLISANLYNFLPQMPYQKHRVLYRDFKLNQWLHGLDSAFFDDEYPLPVEGMGEVLDKITNQNGIICTYHFGVYQLINSILINAQSRFALLVGADVYSSWRDRYPKMMERLDQAVSAGRFVLLNAESAGSLREMYRLIKKGFTMIIYVDGIQGLKQGMERQLTCVSFLGQRIFVPKGAAIVSHYFKVPIYPVLALRRTNKVQILMGETIYPDQFSEKEEYSRYAMTRAFSFLSTYVVHWPEQWTNWSLLHYFLKGRAPINREIDPREVPEYGEYSLIKIQRTSYLLKKANYEIFPLNESDFEILLNRWGI